VISLRRKYASLFPPTGAHNVFAFLSQNNNKLIFSLHELIAFMSRIAVALLDCRPFFVNFVIHYFEARLGPI
jgi:hypothetical protein